VVVTLHNGRVGDVEVVGSIVEVCAGAPSSADAGHHVPIAIDMPIGLVDAASRDTDVAARLLLPGRASSIFNVPPRAVVDAWVAGELPDHATASRLARDRTGKGISQQAWRLVPKIAELDRAVLDGAPVFEVHPEVAFAVLVGAPLPRKRSWAGLMARRGVLHRLGIDLPDRFPGDDDCAPDDVVDAAVCAWVADGLAIGEQLLTIPGRPTQQDRGRPVAIYARRDPSTPRSGLVG
jgi:predicted RNase H-like nuclease